MEPPVSNPFVVEITVGPQDIDAQGHVSNVRVLDWANRAAIAHSAALGYDVPRYMEIGGIFVVRRHEIDYFAPSFEGDGLVLYTWPSTMRRSTSERRHLIRRRGDGEKIAEVVNKWVFVDTTSGKPKKMPPEVQAAFDPAKFL